MTEFPADDAYAERRLAISRSEVARVWNDHDPDAVYDIYTEDYVGHGFMIGLTFDRDRYRRMVELVQHAFPDCRVEVLGQTADADYVYAHWRWTGTHENSLFGVPPSGETISYEGFGRHAHRDGRVSEVWLDVPWGDFYRQFLRGYLP